MLKKPPQIADHVSSYDLHVHTHWSFDGESSVWECLQAADERGISVLAITEHNHMDSAEPLREAAAHWPNIRLIHAAELTAKTELGNVDLLCYGLPVPPTPALAELIATYRQLQQEAGPRLVEGLQTLGIDFDRSHLLAALRTYRPEQMIQAHGLTRPKTQKLYEYLISQGWVRDEAEYKTLVAEASRRVPGAEAPPVEHVHEVVHEAGGLIALAHPQGYFNDDDRDRMDLLRTQCRLDGIECAHPRVDKHLTPIYREYCLEHNLLPVAGSDSHTPDDLQAMFARHGGEPEWIDQFCRALDER